MQKIPIQCTEKELRQLVKALLDCYKAGILKQFGGINLCAFKNGKERKEALINLFYRIEPPQPRWRALKGELYYWVNALCEVKAIPDKITEDDNAMYDKGNYFQTEAEAEIYAKKLREVFAENLKNGTSVKRKPPPPPNIVNLIGIIEKSLYDLNNM